MHINSFVLYRKKWSSSIGILHNSDVHFLCILHNCISLLRSKRASRNEMPFYSINISTVNRSGWDKLLLREYTQIFMQTSQARQIAVRKLPMATQSPTR
jgi:hypothetical protein